MAVKNNEIGGNKEALSFEAAMEKTGMLKSSPLSQNFEEKTF